MTITLKLSTEQERLLRRGAASADGAAMRRVLLQAIDSTIEKLLRLSAESKTAPDFDALTDSPAEKIAATASPELKPLPKAERRTLKELLLAESPRAEIPIPSRQRWRRRAPVAFE